MNKNLMGGGTALQIRERRQCTGLVMPPIDFQRGGQRRTREVISRG